jgi:signal transduction histidine kinase
MDSTAASPELVAQLRQQLHQRELECQDTRQAYIRLLAAQEQERVQLAWALREGIFQDLFAIRLGIERAYDGVAPLDADLASHLLNLRDFLGQRMETVNRLGHALTPDYVGRLGLPELLHQLAAEVTEHHQLKLSIVVTPPDIKVSRDLALAIYRMAQAALANVTKHAQAHHAEIYLAVRQDKLILTIDDDGIGFNEAEIGTAGAGLISIRDRAAAFGGQVRLETTVGSGTVVEVSIPFESEGRAE